ncbi:spore photoproduct lyase family protein [Methylomarinum sp. Ch1-1]|uniref:Spore photoproduct lyase family protein n=1 Tax=Methylomarinum roseum TaxID=3067653 RepID=A0AAU7NWF5_9GAMM
MIDSIYIEQHILQHPRVKQICARFPDARQILCRRYGEVFNPKAQNFRLQKQRPALILAEKFKHFVLPAPPGYGIGAKHNYYFSHMLNCLYDCRYCFLQGMYQSANYVLFVNYEDYQDEIRRISRQHKDEAVHFFSGYDCDSLAFEPVTGFAEHFLPLFETLPNAWLELRTKSTQIRTLLNRPAMPRCVVAFSLAPEQVAAKVEHKAPPLQRRLEAMRKLQQQGWSLGLRFDPLIYQQGYQQQYQQLFDQVFEVIDVESLHSASLGVFRLPEKYFKKMHKLYPQEKLFASPLQTQQGMTSYRAELEQEMMQTCGELLLNYIPADKFFPCTL